MSLARLSPALVLLGSIGCATLRPVHDPAQFITQNHPLMVYITYTDNSSLPVNEPRVSGDSLFGKVAGAGSDTVAVPLHEVSVVQAVQRDVPLHRFAADGPGPVPRIDGDMHGVVDRSFPHLSEPGVAAPPRAAPRAGLPGGILRASRGPEVAQVWVHLPPG